LEADNYFCRFKVKKLKPTAIACLSDGEVYITAEFTESCIADLHKAHPGKPFSGYGNGFFHLLSYEIIFVGSSAELFEKGDTTLVQQVEGRFTPGEHGTNEPRISKASSELRMIVRSMKSLGADGNPVIGKPKPVNKNETIRRLLRLVPVKESRLPTLPAKTESKPVTSTNETPASPVNSSSQPFATQAGPGLYQDSDEEDDDSSVISQQGTSVKPEKPKSKKRAARDHSDLDFTGAQGVSPSSPSARKSKAKKRAAQDHSDLDFTGAQGVPPSSPSARKPKAKKRAAQDHSDLDFTAAQGVPPSSPPVRSIRPDSKSSKANSTCLDPGWGEMTEVTWEMARIPKDQREKLEKTECNRMCLGWKN
jgi:hypothetical protein